MYIPGPVCTQILAGLGATVTKVERPGGDPMRTLPPLGPDGQSPMFAIMNHGKRLVTLDLKRAEDAAALRDLASQADVLVDGLRPGSLERLGLGASTLCVANPRLIYCAISGFGVSGSAARQAGHDLNMQALAGLMAMTAVQGMPAMPGAQHADMISGMAAATAILAALQARNLSGAGMAMDVPMAAAARWLMAPWYAVSQSGYEVSLDRGHILSGAQAYYRVYRTADGRHLALAALEQHFWERFCATIGRPDLVEFHDDEAAQPAVMAAVEQIIATHTLAEWEARFAGVDACVSPVRTVAEAAEGAASVQLPLASLTP